MVEKVIKNNNLEGAPDLAKRLHNCDEAGLSTNPVSKKVFIPKREKNAYLKAPGAGKASYSVLFCVSADGDLCPLLLCTKEPHKTRKFASIKREKRKAPSRNKKGTRWVARIHANQGKVIAGTSNNPTPVGTRPTEIDLGPSSKHSPVQKRNVSMTKLINASFDSITKEGAVTRSSSVNLGLKNPTTNQK
eukprot:gene8669-9602_t